MQPKVIKLGNNRSSAKKADYVKSKEQPPLTRASRQLRSEGLAIFYGKIVFHDDDYPGLAFFNSTSLAGEWLQAIGSEDRKSLTQLYFKSHRLHASYYLPNLEYVAIRTIKSTKMLPKALQKLVG